MYVLMGLGMAGIGMSVMHDANHGAYSKNSNVNKWVGKIVNLIGGFASTWKVQHNVLHHTYTNIHGYDEDIAPIGIMRFSPNEKFKVNSQVSALLCLVLLWLNGCFLGNCKRFPTTVQIQKDEFN